MFELIDVDTDPTVIFRNKNDDEIDFTISPVINKKLREPVKANELFLILNDYLEYKGNEFINKLYNVLIESKNVIILQATRQELDPMPFSIIHNILDMFNFEDVKEFVSKSKYVNIPETLPDEFDINILLDERGSREQTYVKNDYVELIALITILKATTGVIGLYTAYKINILGKTIYKEYLLLNFYRTHSIFDISPFKKIFDSVKKLVERMVKDSEVTAIRIIEKTLTLDTMPTYVTALVVIQKLLVNSEVFDNSVRNTITKIYTYASDQLSLKDNNSKTIIKYYKSKDTDIGDAESVFESPRSNANVSTGSLEEFKMPTYRPYLLAKQVNLDLSNAEIDDTISKFSVFKANNSYVPTKEAIIVTSWIFKDVIDPRAFDYLELDQIVIYLAIAYKWLLIHQFESMAFLVSCSPVETNEFRIGMSLRNKLSPDVREELYELFPFMRHSMVNGQEKDVNYIEESINIISKKLSGYNLFSVLPSHVVKKDFNTDSIEYSMPSSIKNILGKLIITLNR